jgi:hypothetical protein
MSDDFSREATSLSQGSDEQTFEINVKTLENQVHKVRATKNVISLSLYICQICVSYLTIVRAASNDL